MVARELPPEWPGTLVVEVAPSYFVVRTLFNGADWWASASQPHVAALYLGKAILNERDEIRKKAPITPAKA
jgi:hypothetical protein